MRNILASLLLAGSVLALTPPASASVATLDVLATAPLNGSPKNIGGAVGVRLGHKKGLALVPLVNLTDINGKVRGQQGLALVLPLYKHVDVGFAEIARPGSDFTINHQASYAPSVVLGIRF